MALTRSDNESGRLARRYRYLFPHEQEQIVVHRHPAILLGPAFAVLCGLGIAGLAGSLPAVRGYLLLAVWLAWGLLLLRLLWRAARWLSDYFVVTSDRLMVVGGILATDVAMVPFSQLLDITYQRSTFGRSLGYGSMILAVDDELEPSWKIDFLPYPEQLFHEILALLTGYLPDEADIL